MAQKLYVLDGVKYKSEEEYRQALHDKKIIDRLREITEDYSAEQIELLIEKIRSGAYPFHTRQGLAYARELELRLSEEDFPTGRKREIRSRQPLDREDEEEVPKKKQFSDELIEELARKELRKRYKRRRYFLLACTFIAFASISWYGIYTYFGYRTAKLYKQMREVKEQAYEEESDTQAVTQGPLYTLDGPLAQKEVLDEYKNLISEHENLIGWIKIDDTNIDYPVMQGTDNSFYLTHDVNDDYDKNGSIFMDKDCDVLKPSTNFIVYGHHMASGRMFGKLGKYESEEYGKKHRYISFDTIYEKATYEVMYVFRSRVYNSDSVAFKYYQFVDANSEQEFLSYMEEMAADSLYDMGVTAQYGDQLLTLTTCDYHEKNGRFVVVAKKVTAKE